MTILRLVLGDQLNPLHSWFETVDPDALVVMMEMRQETDYVLHHAQKILAIFAAMREFARQLEAAGHRVVYLRIDDPENTQSLTGNLDWLIARHHVSKVRYQAPDEWRLDAQLAAYGETCAVSCLPVDSEHFYTARHEVGELFKGRKNWLMETFYRQMRQRHGVLMKDKKNPVGGQWNFDHDNRKAWPGTPSEPMDLRPSHDHGALWQTIVAAGVASFGVPSETRLRWPLNRTEALEQLEHFVDHALPYFGDFQDAMSTQATRLFHSLLSFAMNVKMLSPAEVVNRVELAWKNGQVPLPAAEGFIRQILGWREYMRGVYWARMPGYTEHNFFGNDLPLPSWFWDGKTNMRCLSFAIGDSLQHAHAHHIQRLMVIGNFALLAGIDPVPVHHWYLGIYIDAFEWVEMPNTLGMSQFADGGMLATKPYVSSAAYIDRMSDYCKGCHYDRKQRLGEKACPFNSLYWDFFSRNGERLSSNPRLGMVYRQLEKMGPEQVEAVQVHASGLRSRLDSL
ncbi:MAG: cryptochrome/photolyase family protein [Janthinobacterium lividum]